MSVSTTEVALNDEMESTLKKIPMFLVESFPESSQKSKCSSVSWWQRQIVFSRNYGVFFWQYCFPSHSFSGWQVILRCRYTQTWAHSRHSFCRSGTLLPCGFWNCQKGRRPCLQEHIRKVASTGRRRWILAF